LFKKNNSHLFQKSKSQKDPQIIVKTKEKVPHNHHHHKNNKSKNQCIKLMRPNDKHYFNDALTRYS